MVEPPNLLHQIRLEDELAPGSNQGTAKKAKAILCDADGAFREPSRGERRAIAAAFAAHNFVVYGQAFDLVKCATDLELGQLEAVAEAIHAKTLTLVEVKSTRRELDENFSNHFFSISTAELLVAQSLGSRYKFAFVNTGTRNYSLVSLQDIYRRAKAIYPTWSIRLDDQPFVEHD